MTQLVSIDTERGVLRSYFCVAKNKPHLQYTLEILKYDRAEIDWDFAQIEHFRLAPVGFAAARMSDRGGDAA